MVALAACLLAFAPGSAAFALAASETPTASPRSTTASSSEAGRPADSAGVDSVESKAADHAEPSVVYHYLPTDDGASDRPGPKHGGETADRDPGAGVVTPTTTTTTTAPTRSVGATSDSTSSPSTTVPTSPDDATSADESMVEPSGSIAEPSGDGSIEPDVSIAATPMSDRSEARPIADAESVAAVTGSPAVTEPESGESVSARRAALLEELAAEWSFLTGDELSARAASEPIESGTKASTVVLSWFVGRDSMSPSMAALSPVLVLLTILDAAASAGSGLAAPASALGTFVLLVLFEKGHLANGARLLRRRVET